MPTSVNMQRLSKFVATSEVLEWLKSPGDIVSEGEALLTVESDKATVELPAPDSGVLLSILVPAGQEAPAGAVLGWIGQPGEIPPEAESVSQAADPAQPAQPVPIHGSGDKVRAVPAARRLAAQHGITLDKLDGSGPGGVITTSDVERAVTQRELSQTHESLDGTGEPETRIIPLDGLLRGMAQRMTLSHQSIVQATTVADVDMTEITRLRERITASYTAFVIKASAQAVADYPLVNASLQQEKVVLKEHVHMGVAVATDDGLLVPVIRHVQRKSLLGIHRELETLAGRAHGRALKSSELGEPTMSVTNSGALGSLFFTPIIVAPQAVTLGMGKVAATPVVRDGQIVVRDIMYLCLSYDHRFIDGATAVGYLQRVKSFLEQPNLVWDG